MIPEFANGLTASFTFGRPAEKPKHMRQVDKDNATICPCFIDEFCQEHPGFICPFVNQVKAVL